MNPQEAISAIRNNWPDGRYTILREALTFAIEALNENAALRQEIEDAKEIYSWYNSVDGNLVAEIERLNIVIQQHRGALGYPVPGDIIDDPTIINGLADAMSKEIEQLRSDNAALLKCVNSYAIQEHHAGAVIKKALRDNGKRARECLAKIGGHACLDSQDSQ